MFSTVEKWKLKTNAIFKHESIYNFVISNYSELQMKIGLEVMNLNYRKNDLG